MPRPALPPFGGRLDRAATCWAWGLAADGFLGAAFGAVGFLAAGTAGFGVAGDEVAVAFAAGAVVFALLAFFRMSPLEAEMWLGLMSMPNCCLIQGCIADGVAS